MHPAALEASTRLKHLSNLGGAGEGSGPRNGVRCWLRPIELELDARICAFVCAGKADGCWARVTSSSHIDLRALHVQLCSRIICRAVKGNELSTEEIPAEEH